MVGIDLESLFSYSKSSAKLDIFPMEAEMGPERLFSKLFSSKSRETTN